MTDRRIPLILAVLALLCGTIAIGLILAAGRG